MKKEATEEYVSIPLKTTLITYGERERDRKREADRSRERERASGEKGKRGERGRERGGMREERQKKLKGAKRM